MVPFQFVIVPETTMKVTKDTVTIKELELSSVGLKGQTVQLKDADPNKLQLFINKMPAIIKGKSVKYMIKLTVCTLVEKQVAQA